MSREECELMDVQRQMEEEMVEEYKKVGLYCRCTAVRVVWLLQFAAKWVMAGGGDGGGVHKGTTGASLTLH